MIKTFRVASSAPSRFHVLLVEDDDLDVMNVKRAFAKNESDIAIERVPDGRAGLERLRAEGFDTRNLVILLDLNMPKMNGIEFLRELRADPELHRLPVIVLTTSDDERDKVDAYDLNVAGYVLKPVQFSAFVAVMDAVEQYWNLQEFPDPP
ncbi:MAG: response regulator [Nannocystaceae bacterium]|nr:response regulator [Myxococcales bacterium]